MFYNLIIDGEMVVNYGRPKRFPSEHLLILFDRFINDSIINKIRFLMSEGKKMNIEFKFYNEEDVCVDTI